MNPIPIDFNPQQIEALKDWYNSQGGNYETDTVFLYSVKGA